MKPRAILTLSILSAVLFAVSGCNTAKNSLPDEALGSLLSDHTGTGSSDNSDNISSGINGQSYTVSDNSSSFSDTIESSASSKNTDGSSTNSSRIETPVSSPKTDGSSTTSSRHEASVSSKNTSESSEMPNKNKAPVSSKNESTSHENSGKNETSVQNHTHNYYSTVYLPDCTNGGYTVHTCNCGKTYIDKYTNALGHSWSNWRTINEATTTQNGVQKKYCSRCGAEETRYIDKLPTVSVNTSVFATRVVELVNKERANNNLEPLEIDNILMNDAAIRSKELETKFNHIRPNGQHGYEMAFDAGYMSVGENIASGQASPEEVMKSWMNSKGHRANILKEDFTNIGVGFYQDEDGNYYWVQLFGG